MADESPLNFDDIDLDDRIVEIIIELNDRGILTAYSCEGHSPSFLGYISFEEHSFLKHEEKIKEIVRIAEEGLKYTYNHIFLTGGVMYIKSAMREEDDVYKKLLAAIKEVFNAESR